MINIEDIISRRELYDFLSSKIDAKASMLSTSNDDSYTLRLLGSNIKYLFNNDVEYDEIFKFINKFLRV